MSTTLGKGPLAAKRYSYCYGSLFVTKNSIVMATEVTGGNDDNGYPQKTGSRKRTLV